MGRLSVGRWAGVVALGLCLTTGCVYGSLFFTPIDISFLFAMTLATLAVIVMAGRMVPSWPATLGAGALTGLAIATRSPGLITQVYLLAALGLCGLEALARPGGAARNELLRIGARAVGALAAGWTVAFALWPWLQIGNPLTQFEMAFRLFANHPNSFEFPSWGQRVFSTDLPWTYVPGQLLARFRKDSSCCSRPASHRGLRLPSAFRAQPSLPLWGAAQPACGRRRCWQRAHAAPSWCGVR
jgi:hypothetical protein